MTFLHVATGESSGWTGRGDSGTAVRMSAQVPGLGSILAGARLADDAQVKAQLAAQKDRVHERMRTVAAKIAVMSGKGGVGKSVTTVSLALALMRRGLRVGVLDVDLNGPCVAHMLGLQHGAFALGPNGAQPPVAYGIKVASLAFFLSDDAPVRFRGPRELSPVWLGAMEAGVVREMIADVEWGALDVLLCDLPPGAAADKPPLLLSLLPDLAGAVVVTTPSGVASEVVRKAVFYAHSLGIRTLGLVDNMRGVRCSHCGNEESLWGGDGAALASELGVPFLGSVPFDRALAQALDRGQPLFAVGNPTLARYDDMAAKLVAALASGLQARGEA